MIDESMLLEILKRMKIEEWKFNNSIIASGETIISSDLGI